MKRALSFVLVAGVAFSLRHSLRAPIPHAVVLGDGAGTPSGNGDVNGDGGLDLTDAVYVLQHLFQGGPAPVSLASKAAGLPATGQTKCYDDADLPETTKEISCDSAELHGQDGFYQKACPMEDRFVDNGDRTVTDNCTGLMWQKETAPEASTQQIALRYCEDLILGGHSDWRLHNVRELQSIVDYGRLFPSVDPVFEARSGRYRSSTGGYVVDFGDGTVWGGDVVYVRAVRSLSGGTSSTNGDVNADGKINVTDAISLLQYLFQSGPAPVAIASVGRLPPTGQTKCYGAAGAETPCDDADFPGQDGFYQMGCPTEGRFVDNGDGTVTDNCTGLMWQKETAPGTYTWRNGLKYCEDLTLGGHSDWRLPNVRELQSIVDYGRSSPSIDPVFEAKSEYYQTSSTYQQLLNLIWFVDFSWGSVYNGGSAKFPTYCVRAVRDAP